MVGREVTVRVSVDIDEGATVYINDLKVSTTVSTYKELFLATQAYASAIGLKTSLGLKVYLDDLTVYTGLGTVPSATKDSVSYTPPVAYEGERLRVLSFNILHEQFDNVALEDGLTRVDHLNNIISGYNPDIVGLQERPATHKDGITTLLTQNSALAVVDEYRTDTPVAGVIVQTPIMYNTNRYEVVENTEENYNYAHGSILLAEHYNNRNKTEAALNKYSGTKGLSWALLKNKQSGTLVLAINSHFALWSSYATYLNYVEKDAAKDRISNAGQGRPIITRR